MRNPKSELPGQLPRSRFMCLLPKSSRSRKSAFGPRPARSVLECGGPPPLFPTPAHSARGLAHSKTWRTFVALLAGCFLLSAFGFRASGQSYSSPWHTIDGGGGTSTGGVYSVSGTRGQPDAGGPMTGGPFSLTGGFWALPQAVQTEGAPRSPSRRPARALPPFRGRRPPARTGSCKNASA